MKRFPLRALSVFLAAILAVGLVGCDTGDPGDDDVAARFVIGLSGDNEVPPVATNGSGETTLTVNEDSSAILYEVRLADIDSVTQGHIHIGGPDENGPVVTFLLRFTGGADGSGEGDPRSFDDEEVAAEGTITESDISANESIGFDGSLEALLQAFEQGNAYVNVHTMANPSGEVRGQINADDGDSDG